MTQNKETIEESKVIELLRSSSPEDQELGVIIAYREFGSEWCKETFGYFAVYERERIPCKPQYNGGGGYYFHIEGRIDTKLILFDDLTFYLGGENAACVYNGYEKTNQCIEILDMRENKQ